MRRLGPVFLRADVQARDIGYDDNIRFDAEESEGDFTATIVPGLDAIILAGDRGGLRVEQDFDYVAFRTNTDLNHWNSAGRARGLLLLRPALLSVEGRYASIEERPNTEVDERMRREENGLLAAAKTRTGGRLALGASVGVASFDFNPESPDGEEIARRLDRSERTGTIEGEYRILAKTRFTMEGVLQKLEFDDTSEGRGSTARTLMPGLHFDSSAAIQGDVKMGIVDLHAPGQPEDGYRGTVGEAHLGARLIRSGRVKLEGSRELVVSVVPDSLFFLETKWSGAYEQFFTQRTSAEVEYGRGLVTYPGDGNPPAGSTAGREREDHLTSYRLGMKYRLASRLALALSLERLVRDSNVDSLDRDRNLYAIGSTVEF